MNTIETRTDGKEEDDKLKHYFDLRGAQTSVAVLDRWILLFAFLLFASSKDNPNHL